MSNRKNKSAFVRFSQMGFQMAATIGGFAYLGYWLDGSGKTNQKTFTLVLTLAGVFIAMYMIIREVMNMNKDDKE